MMTTFGRLLNDFEFGKNKNDFSGRIEFSRIIRVGNGNLIDQRFLQRPQQNRLTDRVGRVVPQADRRLVTVGVLVAEHAQGGGAE